MLQKGLFRIYHLDNAGVDSFTNQRPSDLAIEALEDSEILIISKKTRISRSNNSLATEWTDYKFTPEGYVAEGDNVVAYGTYTAVNNTTGKPLKARVAHLWKLKDGKIIQFEQFVDSQTVNDTF